MSSRQLRKLQRQRELEQLQTPSAPKEDSDESEYEAPIRRAKPSAFSGFAALGDQDDEADNDDDNEDEPTEASSRPTESASRTGNPSGSSKKSKKKKKKGKKPEASLTPPSSKTNIPTRAGTDDIDEALRELNLASKKAGGPTGSQADATRSMAFERICELLRINTHHLKVVNEMRNLFGREAIAAALTRRTRNARAPSAHGTCPSTSI
ncbi:hypothetical protein O1611_g390 [Lasiodiplodia mahajangana]|uniref:Uncharacterized protein n=1 Tax=Lasiodiplodia mahajangana TaxID=1108764 RepID=A0ACC2K0B9_9PEZI|nr:hypothetical protein O1611_g390 [Lasiodiplodia mahajangana]